MVQGISVRVEPRATRIGKESSGDALTFAPIIPYPNCSDYLRDLDIRLLRCFVTKFETFGSESFR